MVRILQRVTAWIRKLRSGFNRTSWLIWLMGLPREKVTPPKRRLILIQIDSLSMRQFKTALAKNRLPFLARLLNRHHYTLERHYSGMPCCTPAVQAELFYGVRGAVPGFNYFDKTAGRPFVLSRPTDAREIERRLEQHPDRSPLLRGGSCYSNIFTGGAAEPHFCISSVGFAPIFTRWKTIGFLCALLLHIEALLRAGVLLALEGIVALGDFIRGVYEGRHAGKELLLVFSRVGMCILLRELLVIGARIDIARALPIIQLNFMGYHDQSHRRGSSATFAHWTLRGIDWAVKRVWTAAARSRTHYDIWIYSDHGQIDAKPYARTYKETLETTVRRVFANENGERETPETTSVMTSFLDRLGVVSKPNGERKARSDGAMSRPPTVTSHSPMGHIYLQKPMPFEERCKAARTLLESSPLPLVVVPANDHGGVALSRDRQWRLPDQTRDLLRADEHESKDLAEDFDRLCHHPDAGDLIVCGASGDSRPALSFALENGAHGGIDPEERMGFCMAPAGAFAAVDHRPLRPLDLHRTAHRLLRGTHTDTAASSAKTERVESFRVMTYNVRNCRGIDGHVSPIRVARVIEQLQPDIVALQELDVGRERSHGHDQARVIAATLRMDHVFFPSMTFEQGHYGNAILSHYPMRMVKSDLLPKVATLRSFERRSALWVELMLGDRRLHVITVHLGLSRKERTQQADMLLGQEWTQHPDRGDHLIFLGDFNFTPRSKLYGRFVERWNDAADVVRGPLRTFRSNFPLVRLDHIFVSRALSVQACRTGNSPLCRNASDHLPLIAEMRFGSTSE